MIVPPPSYGYLKRARELILLALEEDLPASDLTTEAVLEKDLEAEAALIAKENLVVSGLHAARLVFETVDPTVRWLEHSHDGQSVTSGSTIVSVSGKASSLMAAERTALNFLQRLSGIATLTRRMVDKVREHSVVITDTRKTLPGWRILEKAAVRHGGGSNHRFSLSDSVLIKDNHVSLCRGVTGAVKHARAALPPRTRIEVEVTSLEEVEEALNAGADVILVDNAGPELLSQAVGKAGGRAVVEASGGIDEENVALVADTGVDVISSGAVTHSARAVDISMRILSTPGISQAGSAGQQME